MENNQNKRKHLLLGISLIIALAAALYAGFWYSYGQFYESTDDAYVSGNLVTLMPEISGNVVSVWADDTQWVKEGDPLVKLDGRDASLQLERAKAELAETVRSVKQQFEVVKALEAAIVEKQAELEKAKEDLTRRRNLISAKAVSEEDLKHAENNVSVAESSLDYAKHQLDAAKAVVANTTLERHPSVLDKEAQLKKAYLDFMRLSIDAPASGYVAKRSVQIGQSVNPGSALLVIVPLKEIWVDANFKEDQLKHLRVGQPVTLTSDLYGREVEFHGHVAGLGAGTGSVFSLLPPQNATGNWIKVVQRLSVRIKLDEKELSEHPLRIGLSMIAKVDTHDKSGKVLSRAEVTQPIYSTSVFGKNEKEAEKLIAKILRENSQMP